MRIEKKDWFIDTFAIVLSLSDLIRHPDNTYVGMSPSDKDKLRQTQVDQHEVIQILGKYQDFYLGKKFEGTLGWIRDEAVDLSSSIKAFPDMKKAFMSPEDFLQDWKGTLYEFGGLSRAGIDCSGFTQLFYLHVLGITLPKNSFDQRKLGLSKDLKDVRNFDLIFCNPTGQKDHHVVLYYNGNYWHSRRKGGVVSQSSTEFLKDFKVEDVRSLQSA